MKSLLISTRLKFNGPGWDPIFEFEDLICSLIGSELALVVPNTGIPKVFREGLFRLRRGLLRRVIPEYKPLTDIKGTYDVIFVFLPTIHYLDALQSLHRWRKRTKIVIAFVVDSYHLVGANKLTSTLSQIDTFFTPVEEFVSELKKLTGANSYLLANGADVLGMGDLNIEKKIDIIAFGRQPTQIIDTMADYYHSNESKRVFLNSRIYSIVNHDSSINSRRLLLHLLKKSKISICYCLSACSDLKRPFFPMVTGRWLESLAVGCVVCGQRPATPLSDKLFDWEDALIDLSIYPDEAIQELESLLNNNKRIFNACIRNYANMAMRHDWRYRIAEMLSIHDLPVPKELTDEIRMLDLISKKTIKQITD